MLAGAAASQAAAPVVSEEPGASKGKGKPGADIEARLQRIERVVGGQVLIDINTQVERLASELKRLRGELDEQRHLVEQLREENRVLSQRVETLTAPPVAVSSDPAAAGLSPSTPSTPDGTAALATPTLPADALDQGVVNPEQPVPTPELAATAEVVPPATTTAPQTGADEETLYREAFGLLKAGQYDPAIAGFQTYLASFPQGKNADNAQYWTAEAYHVTRRFEPAVAEYQKLINSYPASAKLTHAKLKLGDCLYELGRKPEAIATLNGLVQAHPDSTAARLASERLSRWQ